MLFRSVLLSALLSGLWGLRWSAFPGDHTQIVTCTGSDIQLPWNFTLSPGEGVEDIKWVFRAQGGGEEMIAIFASGNFLPMPAFSARVRRVGPGAIVISGATTSETGNYSILVSTDDQATPLEKELRTVFVQVADPPTMENGKLVVQQENAVIYDNATQDWRVQLTCGVFTFLGQPQLQVVWTTPEGVKLKSSSEGNGAFHLLLPNPPPGGNYTCTLPPLSPATQCLPPFSPLREGATITLDGVKVAYAVLEAKQRNMEKEIHAQNQAQAHIMIEHDLLRADMESLKAENERLKNASCNCMAGGNSSFIGFHAKLTAEPHFAEDDVVKPWTIFNNEGQAFDPSTGEFTAPRDGFYFFLASTGSARENGYANIKLYRTAAGFVSETWLQKYNNFWSMGSCHATLRLDQGEKVWIQAGKDETLDHESTSFSGFMIASGNMVI